MGHGDAHRVVAAGDGSAGKAVPLRTQHHRQLFLRQQSGIVDGQRIVAQRHGGGLEAHTPQQRHARLRPGGIFREIRPGDLEHGAHADPHRTAVQGVAAGGGEQHRVHIQRGGAAENGADIGGVHHVLQHCHPAGAGAYRLQRGQCRTAHGAQHTAGQLEARQLLQHLQGCSIDRDVRRATRQQLPRLSLHVAALHQERHRLTARIQRPADHQRAFRDEKPVRRIGAVYQLVLRQAGVYVQLRCVKVRDLPQLHGSFFLSVLIFREGSARSRPDGHNGRRGQTPCGHAPPRPDRCRHR